MIGVLAAAGLSMVALGVAPVVSNVKVQQRYPWNALVDIDYTLSGDTDGMTVAISVRDAQNDRTYVPTNFLSSLPANVGTHRVTWNPVADGASIVSTNIFVTVSLVYATPPEPASDGLYCVIDLSGGSNASSYPVTYLDASPSGGFNTDEYKTTKLVLRKIDPGTFMMGGSTSTTLTMPFYMGMFEVTQRQWELVMGSNPCSSTSYGKGDTYAVHYVSYDMVRGSSAGSGWPGSSAVDSTSFLGKLRTKTGIDAFDLPTEAQWEYSCRAGTTTAFSCGNSANGEYMWYSENSSSISHPVGTKLPNAWGLYDMHGNMWEWTLDRNGTLAGGSDPKGPSSGMFRVLRGGSWYNPADCCTSSHRNDDDVSSFGASDFGFRLARTLSNQ